MQIQSINFKSTMTHDERREHCLKMLEKNPDKIPVICEKHKKSKLSDLDRE